MNILYRILVTLICVWMSLSDGYTQIKVIDQKGTLRSVDTSKWNINGIHIFNKNSGNVGIGTTNPHTKLHTIGTLRFQALGTNTANTNLLTSDASGNITLRSLDNALDGNAVTTINNQTGSIQTFFAGTSGTDFNISSSSNVHTFSIPSASAANRGALTAADWTAFNNKQNAISLTTSGNSGAATFASNTLNIPNYTLAGLGGISLASLSATAPLLYNSGTGAFSMPQANGTTNGFLTSTDWTSFNNKISSIIGTSPISASTTGTTTTIGITRNNIVAGSSSNIATNPLVLDAGATNAIVGGSNATLTVNNTAPLWNANQLQGRNIVTTAPTDGQVLTWNGTNTNWAPANPNNWLLTGNNNATYNTNFLGTINDVPMTLRSNNTAMLEVGRRQTLGLYDSSNTGLFPYNQPNASVMYVRGTGGNSALQFESSGASFYKPLFFTDSDGNFMMRGSSAGTDFFEMGSAGTANNGSFTVTIGDDGNEPIVFQKYNYSPAGYIELMRLQGTGLNNTVRAGINTGGVTANSTLQVVGSISPSIASTATALTLDETHYTVIVTANVNITLPAAGTCTGRYYIIKKTNNSSSTITSYIDTNGSASTTLSRGVYHLQSDGTNWQRLN